MVQILSLERVPVNKEIKVVDLKEYAIKARDPQGDNSGIGQNGGKNE